VKCVQNSRDDTLEQDITLQTDWWMER